MGGFKAGLTVSVWIAFILLAVFGVVLFLVDNASALDHRGPRIDTLRYNVTRSPAAQLVEMYAGPPSGSDVWTRLIRPADIEVMDSQGKKVTYQPGFHMAYVGFSLRKPLLDDVNFRHALAHLMPKDQLIGNMFKYVVARLDTMVPPSMTDLCNELVDQHAYSPSEAEAILAAAGYQKIGDVWKMPDGSDMPTLRFFAPMEVVRPTSFAVSWKLIQEAQNIGLTNIVFTPMDLATYLMKVYDEHDFEIYWEDRHVGVHPNFLYNIAHSSETYNGSSNPTGINWPQLDAQLETVAFSLNNTAAVVATKKAQEMLTGGTFGSTLAKPAPADFSQAIPYLPVYSMTYYDAQQPQLQGAVNEFGSGIDNIWTRLNISWNTPNEYRPGTTQKTVVWIAQDSPERLNPAYAKTKHAWDFMDPLFDSLIVINPWSQIYEPWLATHWDYTPYIGEPLPPSAEGMRAKFWLRDDVYWQDGTKFTIDDVKFAWLFLRDNKIPKHRYFTQFITDVQTNTDENSVIVFLNTTSQWFLYDLARTAAMFPPQVWNRAWASTDEILNYDPSADSPDPGGLPSKLFGTGPFILQHSTAFIRLNGYGDLKANRNYFLTTVEIEERLKQMSQDTTPPKTTMSLSGVLGDNDWFTSDVTVTLSAIDIGSGVNKTEYSFDNITWTTYAIHFTITTEGTTTVYYRSTDKTGNVETTKTKTIKLDKTAPTANAGPDQTVNEDTLVTFDASASQDENGIKNYTWTFTDVTPQTLTGKNPTYTFATPGTYTITLKATDPAGNHATDVVVITVLDITNPTAHAGTDQTVNEDLLVTFDAGGSTDNVAITAYTWAFTDATTKTLTGPKPTYTFNTPGVYIITLNVTDAAGNWATDTITVTVLDITKPVAKAGQDQTVNVGATVSFDAGGSTDNVGIVSYEWSFGDGTTGTGVTPTHTYTSSGTYTVTLTVKDAAGNSASDSITVTVRPAEVTPPPAEAFPMWIVGAIITIIGIAVGATLLLRRRKSPQQNPTLLLFSRQTHKK